MTHFLDWIYNWSFLMGGVFGFVLMRLYCRVRENRNGEEHTHMSRNWLAVVLTMAVLGYVLLTAQRAQTEAIRIADAQVSCQNDLNRVVKERSSFTERTNVLNKHRQDLLDQLNEDAAAWLNQLLNPPPDIAALEINDIRRQEYGIGVSRDYFEHAAQVRAEIADVRDQQDRLTRELASHPIPALCRAPVK